MADILHDHRWWRPAAAIALAALASAQAYAAGERGRTPAGAWVAVDEARLDAMRGGFVTPSGLIVSLGIERSLSINGTLVTQTSLHIADVRALGKGDAASLQAALAPVMSQRGTNNLLPPGAGHGAAGTFVQNALNDQAIGTRTVISTTLNSGTLLKEINFNSSVREASLNALAPRN